MKSSFKKLLNLMTDQQREEFERSAKDYVHQLRQAARLRRAKMENLRPLLAPATYILDDETRTHVMQ